MSDQKPVVEQVMTMHVTFEYKREGQWARQRPFNIHIIEEPVPMGIDPVKYIADRFSEEFGRQVHLLPEVDH